MQRALVLEELKTDVKEETSAAIMTESKRPFAPCGSRRLTSFGYANSCQPPRFPQTASHTFGSAHATYQHLNTRALQCLHIRFL